GGLAPRRRHGASRRSPWAACASALRATGRRSGTARSPFARPHGRFASVPSRGRRGRGATAPLRRTRAGASRGLAGRPWIAVVGRPRRGGGLDGARGRAGGGPTRG